MEDTETRIIEEIRKRQKIGIEKYGCTLAENRLTLTTWIQHAKEETLDLALYLQRIQQELEEEDEQQ